MSAAKKPRTRAPVLLTRLATGEARSPDLVPVATFVLAKGERLVVSRLTQRERELVRAAKGKKTLPPGACFDNAQRVLFADPSGELDYVEGYAPDPFHGEPIHHAWLAIGRKVAEVTWAKRRSGYFGVRFSQNVVRAKTSRQCPSILEAENFALIRNPSVGWPGWSAKLGARET